MTGGPRIRFGPDGIEVEQGLLWLDATRPKPFCVISHAHGDHVARHRRALCTAETAELVRIRQGPGTRCLPRRFGEPTRVGDLVVTLHPAGHILGSAMVHVEGPQGTLLYTGDAKLEGGRTSPPAGPVHADVMITEATFGRPDLLHPPAGEVHAALVRTARETLEAGVTPIFLAYALGKAQEVMAVLCDARLPVAAHGSAWNLCRVYRGSGIRFPGARRLARDRAAGCVLVVPPRELPNARALVPGPTRVVAVTGWRLPPDEASEIDATLPLSDHSDFNGLLKLVELCAPDKVHVVHGFAPEFAAALRERGYDAQAVPGHEGPAVDGPAPGMFAGL